MNRCLWENDWVLPNRNQSNLNGQAEYEKILSELKEIKVLCEQTRELTHDFLDYV